MNEDLDAALDRLYGLPAGEFTAARDALAKELRAAKRRDDAAEVKALRRPTAPAAAINQLARGDPSLVDALLDAAGELRTVQERLLAGDAGRNELRAAADAERRAVGALVSAAGRLPDALSPAALERVRATLHAAATDDEVRDAIARGRLEREAESSGAWGGLPVGLSLPDTAPSAPPRRRAPAASESDVAGAGAARAPRATDAKTPAAPDAEAPEDEPARPSAADRARERRAAKRAAELERVRATAAAADAELAAAEHAAAEAHKELEAAAEQAEAARAVLAQAERDEEAARAAAQKTLRTLKRAEALAADAAEQVARLERDDR